MLCRYGVIKTHCLTYMMVAELASKICGVTTPYNDSLYGRFGYLTNFMNAFGNILYGDIIIAKSILYKPFIKERENKFK